MNSFDVFYKNAIIPPPEAKSENIKYTRLAIDSKDRDKSLFPNANNYEVRLNNEIDDVISAKLINADIPLSMYMINKYFDTLVVQQGSDTPQNIQLDHGNYNENELATLITDALNNAFGDSTFTVTYNTNKDNFSFVSTSPFSLIFGTSSNSLDMLLGFSKKTYTSINLGRVNHVINAEYRKNFNYNNCIIMYIDKFDTYQSPSNEIDRCFAILPSVYTLLSISDNPELIKIFSPPIPRLAKLIISFYDRYGNPYDFSNMEHRFEILVKSHKQARKYNQIFGD